MKTKVLESQISHHGLLAQYWMTVAIAGSSDKKDALETALRHIHIQRDMIDTLSELIDE